MAWVSGRVPIGKVSYLVCSTTKDPSNSNPTLFADGGEARGLSFFGQLPYEEDFGIFLLRVGTASLEATGLRGWNNEVAPIALPVKPRNRAGGNKPPSRTYGRVKMGRNDVVEVQYGSSVYATTSASRMQPSSNPSNPYEDLSIRRRRRTNNSETQQRQQRGLFNEVQTIELDITNTAEPPRGISGCWRQIKQSWPFFVALWDVLKGLVFLLWDRARYRGRNQQADRAGKPSNAERHQQEESDQSAEDDEDSADDTQRRDGEKEIYSRFLRGEEISDDEHDDDFTSSLEDDDSRGGVEDDGEEEVEEEEDGEIEVVRLFSDFLRNGRSAPTTSVGGGEMVLAHLLHGQATPSGPLTRQGWRELVEQGAASHYRSHLRNHEVDIDNDNIWNQLAYIRSNATPADSQSMSNTTTCVICTNGQRDIICWPCRYVLCHLFFFLLHCSKKKTDAWLCAIFAGRRWLLGVLRQNIVVHVVVEREFHIYK